MIVTKMRKFLRLTNPDNPRQKVGAGGARAPNFENAGAEHPKNVLVAIKTL